MTMIIEERTKKAIKLFLRFLKQENLLMEYKKDFNIELKLRSLDFKCKEQIFSLEEFIQMRLNKSNGDYNYIFKSLIDKTLVYKKCEYRNWDSIDVKWGDFFWANRNFLK